MAEKRFDETVGVVGLGDVGGPIARSMVRAGFDVVGFDIRPEAIEELVTEGGRGASSLEELVSLASVISVIVVSDEQVRDVMTTVLERADPGSLVLIQSTVRPSTVVELAEAGAPRGVSVIDVAIGGGHDKAELGTLSFMIGGDAELVERCRPLLEPLSRYQFHLGPVGAGLVAKLINNLLVIGNYALLLEAMELGVAYGLEEDAITSVISVNEGDSRQLHVWGRHDRARRERLAEGTDWTWRMGRDLGEATIAGGRRDVLMPLTASVAEMIPFKLRQRDLQLKGRDDIEHLPRCSICRAELAAPFRTAGAHPECLAGGLA